LKKKENSAPKRFLNLRIALTQIPFSVRIAVFILVISVILSVNVGISEKEYKEKGVGLNAYDNGSIKGYYYKYKEKTGRDYFIDTSILSNAPILKWDISNIPLVLDSPLSYIFRGPRYTSGPFTYGL